MVDLGQKPNFWWSHWVIVWEEKLELEDAAYILSDAKSLDRSDSILTFVWRLARAVNRDVEIS